ncbi:hypothetical protein EDD19_1394 [Dietzia cinnamea]|uniref:Uncharacterized protein n=3 Tax=Dietzia cinnamea TaxID=321318 RepID=A0A4R3ZNE1_9ACTN|nr:hypothetical protein EDD19_1394 [Dietzia cinnamea]
MSSGRVWDAYGSTELAIPADPRPPRGRSRNPTRWSSSMRGAAARRTARLGTHFQPQLDDPGLIALCRAECLAPGHRPGLVVVAPVRLIGERVLPGIR